MGGEEILWRDAYEAEHCYDCLNSMCGRKVDDMIACQFRKCLKGLEKILESEEE